MQHLLRFGFLDGPQSLFDYGCGRGDDLRLLSELNVPASGGIPSSARMPNGSRPTS